MKNLFWSRSPGGRAIEGVLYLMELAIGLGLISGAAFVALVGNFLLSAMLGLIAAGVLLRLKRRRLADRRHQP